LNPLGFVLVMASAVLLVVGVLLSWIPASSIAIVAGIYLMALLGGIIAARGKREEVKLTGRVFEFPQAPIMVEMALRRYGSIIPRRMTEAE